MTPADAISNAERDIDEMIDRYPVAFERRIRLDLAEAGSEDQDALDRPPEPGSPRWRLTVEEILIVNVRAPHGLAQSDTRDRARAVDHDQGGRRVNRT